MPVTIAYIGFDGTQTDAGHVEVIVRYEVGKCRFPFWSAITIPGDHPMFLRPVPLIPALIGVPLVQLRAFAHLCVFHLLWLPHLPRDFDAEQELCVYDGFFRFLPCYSHLTLSRLSDTAFNPDRSSTPDLTDQHPFRRRRRPRFHEQYFGVISVAGHSPNEAVTRASLAFGDDI